MPDRSLLPPPLAHSPTPARALPATALWYAVLNARAAWARERHLPQQGRQPSAQVALLDALDAYVSSLDERGHPVPYVLRDELRLQRLTCGGRRPGGPVTS